jgi:hypothetical protein
MVFRFNVPVLVKRFGWVPAIEHRLHVPAAPGLIGDGSHDMGLRHVDVDPLEGVLPDTSGASAPGGHVAVCHPQSGVSVLYSDQ